MPWKSCANINPPWFKIQRVLIYLVCSWTCPIKRFTEVCHRGFCTTVTHGLVNWHKLSCGHYFTFHCDGHKLNNRNTMFLLESNQPAMCTCMYALCQRSALPDDATFLPLFIKLFFSDWTWQTWSCMLQTKMLLWGVVWTLFKAQLYKCILNGRTNWQPEWDVIVPIWRIVSDRCGGRGFQMLLDGLTSSALKHADGFTLPTAPHTRAEWNIQC